MKFAILVAVACLATLSTTAGTATRTVDSRSMFTRSMPSKDVNAQSIDPYRFVLNTAAAKAAFADGPATLLLENFPIGSIGAQTLRLERTRSVTDANTKALVGRKGGFQPIVLEPVISYKGTINGDPETRVSLHYTQSDITGYIQMADGQRLTVGREYGTLAVPSAIPHVVVPDQMLMSAGANFVCGADNLPVDIDGLRRSMETSKTAENAQAEYMRELKLALEVNQDLWQKMHNRGMSDAQIEGYFIKVVACLSQAYEEELDATFYVTQIQMYTDEFNTPYQNNGLNPGALLSEFSLNWSANYNDVDRHLAHLFTELIQQGGLFIGGIAYGGQSGPRLCNKAHEGAYGVSTMYGNASPMPGNPGIANAFTWDIFVIAHEMGHNVGAPHTHNCYWNPPVDTCQLSSDGTDACYNAKRTVRPGTIMSYCHLVNGSTTPLTFGTRVAAKMKQWVQASCAQAPVKPIIRITEPRGSETFQSGDDLQVKFATARVDLVTLQYSVNNGTTWETVKTGINPAERVYTMKVPAIPTSQFLIRMISDADNTVGDTTLASYTLNVPLSLLAPKGGERIAGNSVYTIRWQKTASVGNCDVTFSRDGGTTWEDVATGVAGSSFDWTVPDVEINTAVIRVKQSSGSLVATGNAFTIGKPRFALQIPVTGGTVCNNFPNQYRWSADFYDKIRIQFSTNNGTNWVSATQALSLDGYGYETFSLSTQLKAIAAGTKIQMRVVNNANTQQVLATIDNVTVQACDAAVSVNEADVTAGDLAIVSVTPNPARADATMTVRTAKPMTISVALVDAAGQMISLMDSVTLSADGEQAVRLPLPAVAAGSYQLVVTSGSVSVSTPLSIVR